MRKPNNSEVRTMIGVNEVIVIESDSEEDNGGMLALCGGEVNTSRELVNATLPEDGETNMQIVCVDDDLDPGVDCDLEYLKFLTICNENGNPYLLEDTLRDDSPLRIMYNVDNKESDKKKVEAVKNKKKVGRKAKKIGKAEHKSKSKTVLKIEKKRQKKGIARQGKKIALTKNTTEPKKRGRGRPRKNPETKNSLKVSKKKKNEKTSVKRKAESQIIVRAPKRLKIENERVDHNSSSITIPSQRKKVEAPRGREILVTKNNLERKSTTSHAEDRKKENKESRSLLDKNYAYYLAYVRSSITIFDADRQVKAVKDMVALSDPDIVAVSDRPFADGGKSLFETNKDGKVIDVEHDAIDLFNSSFSTKLMELLRKPYDKEDLVRLYDAASVKRPLTRSRQLRDGREIEYNVDHQFAPSLLDQYPDFGKQLCRYRKDPVRALNLLRGFLFYFENLILEGAFKPWLHEKQLEQKLFDASECKNIECPTELSKLK